MESKLIGLAFQLRHAAGHRHCVEHERLRQEAGRGVAVHLKMHQAELADRTGFDLEVGLH